MWSRSIEFQTESEQDLLRKVSDYLKTWVRIRVFTSDATLVRELGLSDREDLSKVKKVCVSHGLAKRQNKSNKQRGGIRWQKSAILLLLSKVRANKAD